MERLASIFRTGAVLLAILAVAAVPVNASAADDMDALKGVTAGKAVFDVTLGDAGKLALYLGIIEETYEGLVKQGVKPDLVVAVRGPAILLVSKDRERVPKDQQEGYDEIASLLKDLKELGVKLEACSVAARLRKVNTAAIYPEMKVVGNTFISLIGYQSKGYAYIPIF
jgi:intracellular sulfur oxidation DsrE/DsrF family protein